MTITLEWKNDEEGGRRQDKGRKVKQNIEEIKVKEVAGIRSKSLKTILKNDLTRWRAKKQAVWRW